MNEADIARVEALIPRLPNDEDRRALMMLVRAVRDLRKLVPAMARHDDELADLLADALILIYDDDEEEEEATP